MQMTGGEALAKQLEREGVEQIFGVPGVQLDNAMDGLASVADSIAFVTTRHEQGAAYMADGYARSTGREGVCLVVPGPGILNALAGLATAYACSSPVLCIVGQLHTKHLGKGRGVLHEVPEQSRILDSVTKWHTLVTDPREVPGAIREAMNQLRSGKPRPVAVEIPPDVLAAVADIELLDPVPAEELWTAPGEPALRAAAGVLASAQRPVVYAGSGVHLADASEALAAFAEALGAPVIMSRSGMGALPYAHPLAATKLAGRRLLPDADAVIVVGSRFRNFGGASLRPAPEVPVIHLDADASLLDELAAPDVPVLGHAKLALDALRQRLVPVDRPDRREDIAAAKAWAEQELAGIQPQQAYLTAIHAAVPAGSILVSELTQVSYVVRVGYGFDAPRTNLTPGYQGTLGFGFPTALGAKRGNPDRVVISLNGDGGFGWCLQELATAKKYGIAPVIIVFNDGAYGNVRRTQRDQFGGRFIGTDLVNPDFTKLADAFGLRGVKANSPDELSAAIREAVAGDAAVLIEVPVGEMPDPWHLLG